ncbi:hypothetical protein EVAR_5686_1 [Eumeta japonica]|uniref:Uncharacterized protein n=1 Tax=Eumeta variegata TaxID=151549 RepID=A0A4C1T856_EUMVA|nr:hypothetical protein EVAR_5686_1 [Eumeta japonica]
MATMSAVKGMEPTGERVLQRTELDSLLVFSHVVVFRTQYLREAIVKITQPHGRRSQGDWRTGEEIAPGGRLCAFEASSTGLAPLAGCRSRTCLADADGGSRH